MKSFFKYLLASFLALVIAFFIFFLIVAGMVAGLLTREEKVPEVKEGTTLLLKLDQPIADRKTNMPAITLSLESFGVGRQIGLNDLLKTIEKAGSDSNISGIYLELSELQTGIATIEEIRNALIEFGKTGKFIVAFSDTYSQGAYYLASVADKLYLNPAGYINFVGLNAEIMFFRQTLEKLDIEPEIIRHGQFKSAVEPFMYDRMSPENRQQINVYLNSIWSHVVGQISSSRGIPSENLNQYADELLMWSNANASKLGLVDGSLYRDQVLDTINCLSSRCDEEETQMIGYDDYLRVPDPQRKGYSRNKIAVIYASGDIIMGKQTDGFIGSEGMANAIRKARKDSMVKAIVFRVNSGGGSALASEVIWREIDLARKDKPVIASLGDVAASGGYYIVAPADTIIASPVTITGSIGVFGIMVNAGDFLENKLGITIDAEKTNTYSDFGSIFRPLSPDERRVMQSYVDETYRTFVSHVSEGRGIPYADVDKAGEGRVWSGANAGGLNLVDLMGGLDRAIDLAADMAGITDYRIIELPEIEDPITLLINEFTSGIKERLLKNELKENYIRLSEIEKVLGNDRVQARLPFGITVY
ncbi:signal peptide peptidase SppA [bacterium]|nr:MAG: signal peptide peptidase SppA [bacterium]